MKLSYHVPSIILMPSLLCVFINIGVPSLLSQQMVAREAPASAAQAMLAKPVTVTLTAVSLRQAVNTLAGAAGAIVEYRRRLLDWYVAPVSLRAVHQPLGQALAEVLQGTGLRVMPSAGGLLVITEDMVSVEPKMLAGTIAGLVRDARTGQPLRGANVAIDGSTPGMSTDDAGRYRLPGVSAGAHMLRVKYIGYARYTGSVNVTDGETLTVNVALEPSTTQLDQVVVTGTITQTELRAVPNAMTVVTARDIEQRGITKLDQLFRGDVPGLFAMNRGSFNNALDEIAMYSRGATKPFDGANPATNPIKTYVDGVELANPTYLNQIDPQSIERIEILTGPQASTIYGSNAINGVMQIFTKRGARGAGKNPQVTATLSSGTIQNNFNHALTSQHDYSTRLSGIEERWSYNVGGAWNYQGAWTPGKQTSRVDGFGGSRMQLGEGTVDFSARQGLFSNHATGTEVSGINAVASTGRFPANFVTALITAPTTSTLRSQTLGVTLIYRTREWWSHEIVLGTDATDLTALSTAPARSSPSDTLNTLYQKNNARLSQRYTTTAHASFGTHLQATVNFGIDHWRAQSLIQSASGMVLTGTLLNPSLNRAPPDKNFGSFLQGQVAVGDAIFFTYGLRAEWNPNYGSAAQPNVSPRVGMAYTKEIGAVTSKLRWSYGRATRPPAVGAKRSVLATDPTLLTLYGPYPAVLANPDLGPEFQQGGEGGIEVYLRSLGSLVVTRYNQTVNGLIASVFVDSARSLVPTSNANIHAADGYGYQWESQNLNIGSLRNQGWELQGTLNTGPISTRGTYTWAKSRMIGITPKYRPLLASNTAYAPGSPFTLLPEHMYSVSVAYAQSGTTVTVSLNGLGAMYRATDDLAVTTFYSRLDAARSRKTLPSGYRAGGPGYATADVDVSHRLTSMLEGILQMQNAGNTYHNDYGAQYTAIGRQVKLGMRVHH